MGSRSPSGRRRHVVVACAVFLIAQWFSCAQAIESRSIAIVITQGSIRVNGIELRSNQRGDIPRFLSLEAAEKALGQPQDNYPAGLGVQVSAWRDLGIHLQRGWRGPEKGKLFKFQVWLDDHYDKDEGKHSGKFIGRVQVEGVDIASESTLDSVRANLEKRGFSVSKKGAEKGEIKIFAVNGSNRIERIEIWCL